MWPCDDGMVIRFCTVAAEDVDSGRRLACFPPQTRPIGHLSRRRRAATVRPHSAAKAADCLSIAKESIAEIDRSVAEQRLVATGSRCCCPTLLPRCSVDALTSRMRISVVGDPSVTWSPTPDKPRPMLFLFFILFY